MGGALLPVPWLRFHTSLIETDRQISRIRLSDKRHAFTHGWSLPHAAERTSPKCP